ncbi:MAG: HAMP domain-containing protein [Gammaproteobacteria bacterium]|nr:HAMP domain-containing protein [Gammaproteobacteria bacterium]
MPRRLRLPTGVRAQATLLATVVVTGALLIAATTLMLLTRANLTRSLETVLISRAMDIASLASSDAWQSVIPPVRGTSAQVVDRSGRVIATTPDIEGQQAISRIEVPAGGVRLFQIASLDGSNTEDQGEHVDEEGPYLLVVTGAASGDEVLQVAVVGSLAPVRGAVATLGPMLAVGIPLLVVVVAWMTWVLVGRSLRPVEDMITRADGITFARLSRRIQMPEGNDEIHHLAGTLNRMLDRLESSVIRQRRFVSDASHELKSPVASLLTMAEVAESARTQIEMKEFAGDVAGEARRLALLVEDLLILSRADEDHFQLERTSFDLAELVREEVGSMDIVDVSFDVSGLAATHVHVDRRRMRQLARNLLDNAVRHTGGRVWVEAGAREGSTYLVVADDGPGIPQNRREEIFGRFVRLDDARSRVVGGTGLGLAVVKAIVEAHGGTVQVVDDDRFPGAVFRVDLPAGGSRQGT